MAFTKASDLIAVKSPLALVGVFLCILRERFDVSQGLEWDYRGDSSILAAADDERNSSEIHIEAGKNIDTEDYGRRPAIYINRGPISISQPAIGDLLDSNPKIAKKIFYAIAQTNFTFSIEAELPAEAENIADIVLSTLLMGSDIIEATFQFRKLGPFALSSRGTMRQDTEIHQINVNMGLSYDMRWTTLDIGPLMKEVIVKARDSSYTDNNDFFTEIYQHSLADSPNSTT